MLVYFPYRNAIETAHFTKSDEEPGCVGEGCYADPYQFHRSMTTLRRAGLPIEEFSQTSAHTTLMGQTLFDLLNGRNITLYRARDVRQHKPRQNFVYISAE
jgi:hypothetical protein